MMMLALAGCGGSSSPTATEKPAIHLGSSAVVGGHRISASYHCEMRNDWLPLHWSNVPVGTRELALYEVRFGSPRVGKGGVVEAPVEGEAIVVGLKPTLNSLSPGRFPAGVHVAVRKAGSNVVSICPPKGTEENILFRLYALPRKLQFTQGNNPVSVMTKEALREGTFIVGYRST